MVPISRSMTMASMSPTPGRVFNNSQAEQAAAFAERSRLARELHDSVTQSLYSITLYSEAVARMLASGAGSEAIEHLHELRATAQEALHEMRLLIFQLSPPALSKRRVWRALCRCGWTPWRREAA